MSRASACVLLFALLGCGASRTEIVVEVSSDLAVPGQLDHVDITVDGVAGGTQTATAALTGGGAVTLPVSLGVVRTSGPLAPLTITATGTRRGATVVSRRAVTGFVEGHTVVLHLDLLGSCVGRTCAAGETCGETGCASEMIAPSSLAEYVEGGTDAGPTDAGTDTGPIDAGGVDMPGVDLGPRDMGVDLGPRDLGVDMPPPVDAGGMSCDAIFGSAGGYMLCAMDATSCTMAVNTGGTSCNTFCSGFGATCLGAMGNVAPDCTSSGAETCMTPRTTEICVCSR